MKYEIFWKDLHKATIEANSYEEAERIVDEELNSASETYQERIDVYINEIEKG